MIIVKFFKQIYLIFRTVLSVVAMVLSVIWRFPWLRYTTVLLIIGAAVAFFER
jgi:hypothetical protein